MDNENNTEAREQFAQDVAAIGGSMAKEAIAIIPEGWEKHDLEYLEATPRRKTGRYTATRIESLIGYLLRECVPPKPNSPAVRHPNAIAWLDTELHCIKAVLNDNGDANGEAGWLDWVINFRPPKSKAYEAWRNMHDQGMSQVAFAELIAENISDIVKPEGAKLLEMAKNMKAQRSVKYASAVHTGNGDINVAYEQTTTARAGVKGTFKIPEKFELGIPIFEGGPSYKVECEFRYRLTEGSMSFSFAMLNIDRIVDHAFSEIVEQLEKAVSIQTLYGKPPIGT